MTAAKTTFKFSNRRLIFFSTFKVRLKVINQLDGNDSMDAQDAAIYQIILNLNLIEILEVAGVMLLDTVEFRNKLTIKLQLEHLVVHCNQFV